MELRNVIIYIVLFLLVGFILNPNVILASEISYQPSRVVYDVSSPDPGALGNILDRVGMLQKIYNNDSFEASIVLVIHEGAIALFKNSSFNNDKLQQSLMTRARSLAMGEIIKFRICAASARMQEISVDHLEDFVAMVPMADAEIIKLQQDGYSYLR